jgi:signal transduction histidine kinase
MSGAEAAPMPLPRHRGAAAARPPVPLARVFTVAAAVASVIVLAVVAAGGFALVRLVEIRTVAAQVGAPGLISGQQLLTALVDEESGVRGFALSGREEFLEPYRSGRASEQAAVSVLRDLAPRGLRDFGPALDNVQRAADAWRTGYADPVLARSPDAPSPEVGKALFDPVRTAGDTLIGVLTAQRTDAADAVNGAVSSLIWVAVAIAVVLAVFVVVTGFGLRRAVLRPVSHLAEQVRGVASGDLHRQVEAGGPAEIVELGQVVEAMRTHILRDLDRAEDVNRQLAQQADELERSNRDLEQFAYVASHDLQEPLRKVSSFCQLLQRRYGGQLDERADQYIGFAVDGAQRMQQLINDLLTFSRVGRNTEDFELVDLGVVAKQAVGQLETTRAEVQGTIEVGDLPTVTGDPTLLRQLLLNLIGNALKFHRADVAPVVRVQAVHEGEHWCIDVVDNGIGIDRQYEAKIFVIFQRLHARDSYTGTGIGLALAKKIVEFHGGQIGIAPSPGPGTTIRITLPDPVESGRA